MLFAAACATRFPHLDECPNPVMESMSWHPIAGSVTEVVDARTFRLRTDDGRLVEASIAGIGEPFNPRAAEVLRKRLSGKRATVFVNPTNAENDRIAGEVHDARDRDVALDLLHAGLVSYVEAPAYTLSGYSECLLRIAEREAKAGRR